ncbi:MAG: alternative ribosome rescue aminoacyl-tRNA hydrolase ArfB [Acidobacteriota bacterium]
MNEDIIINEEVTIPASELRYRFARSAGPGGQNVNKLATKAELLFDLARSSAFNEADKARIAQKLARHIDSEGFVAVSSQESRSQFQNKRLAARKLAALITRALHVPKSRKKTQPTRQSVTRRLEGKKLRSAVKHHRSKKIDLE